MITADQLSHLTSLTLRAPRSRVAIAVVDAEQIVYRAFAESLIEADAQFWEHRAQQFDNAAPQPGDFNGRAPEIEVAQRRQRCEETAQACRAKAALIRADTDPASIDAEIRDFYESEAAA